MRKKTIKTLLMILWLMPAIAIHADGIVKASSPTTATINSNLCEAAISPKAKTPRLLNAALENQIYQQTCSCDDLNCFPTSQVHCLVFNAGVELRHWVFAFGCGIGRKTCCVDGVTVGELAHQQTQQPHNTGCPSTLPQAKGFF